MKKNIGTTDRAIRIIVAVVISLLLLTQLIAGVVGTILGLLAIVFLLTSVFSFCPLYVPFKISTRKEAPTQTK
ncbi:MAG TPA: DUF2892 domain-containing protein [Bacteroidetes bacterium]|jgi:hypothetical protein|nr:DUF2892 domain-containing protein [Bacteroidota bacterium]